MKPIKKFTSIKVQTQKVDNQKNIVLTYGEEENYYGRSYGAAISEEFDTEEEAIIEAYRVDPYSTWLIVPVIRFDNF